MINVVFGAGFYGRYAYFILKGQGISITSFVVSETDGNPDSIFDVSVRDLRDYKKEKHNIKIYVGVDKKKSSDIYEYINKEGFINIEIIDFPILRYSSFNSMSEKAFLSMWYAIYKGRYISLDNPRTFNEKIQYLKLYGITDLMHNLTDKYKVREWVKNKIGEEYLIPIYGVWNKFEDIEFSILPDKYVLKCNHGCGYNCIVRDSKKFDYFDAKKKFAGWLSEDYGYSGGLELQYHGISPCIIAEEYIENENEDLYDYKFWCFNGKVEFVMYLCEREKGLRMNNYDLDWNLLPFTYNYPNTDYDVACPKNLKKMIRLAEILSEGFPFVRVDLYHLNDGTIKFGEMTFTPASGICNWSDESVNLKLGSLFNIM